MASLRFGSDLMPLELPSSPTFTPREMLYQADPLRTLGQNRERLPAIGIAGSCSAFGSNQDLATATPSGFETPGVENPLGREGPFQVPAQALIEPAGVCEPSSSILRPVP